MDLAQDALSSMYDNIAEGDLHEHNPDRWVNKGVVEYPLNSADKRFLNTEAILFYDKKLLGKERYTRLQLKETLNASALETDIRFPKGAYVPVGVINWVKSVIESETETKKLLHDKGGIIREALKNLSNLYYPTIHIDGMGGAFQLYMSESKFKILRKLGDGIGFVLDSKECSEQAMDEQQILLEYQSGKLKTSLNAF